MRTALMPAVFLIGWAILGLGTGSYSPPQETAVSKVFTEESGLAFGIMLTAGGIGSAALPYLSSQLIAAHGWRTLVTGILGPFLAVALLT